MIILVLIDINLQTEPIHMKRSLENWLAAYDVCHQNKFNKWIHRFCVPLIFVSVYALLFSIPLPGKSLYWNIANLVYFPALIFWFRLSFRLGLLFTFFGFFLAIGVMVLWLFPCHGFDHVLAKIALLGFAIGWIGQFIGHHIEGKKPSFFEDLQFLLIGPIWIFKRK